MGMMAPSDDCLSPDQVSSQGYSLKPAANFADTYRHRLDPMWLKSKAPARAAAIISAQTIFLLPMPMRVATWNLDHASNSKRAITQQIEQVLRVKPDILVLTETCAEVDLARHGFNSLAGVNYPDRRSRQLSPTTAAIRFDAWLRDEAKRTGDGRIPTTRVYRYGPGCVRDNKDLKDAVALLAEHGRARLEDEGRRRFVVVNPALYAG